MSTGVTQQKLLANHLRAVTGTFRPLRTHQCATKYLRDELHKNKVLLITSTLLVVKAKNIYQNTTKMHKARKQSSAIWKLLQTVLHHKYVHCTHCVNPHKICGKTSAHLYGDEKIKHYFFYLDFFSCELTISRTAEEGRGPSSCLYMTYFHFFTSEMSTSYF